MSFVTDISVDTRIPLSDTKKKEAKEKLKNEHEADNKMVKGVFKNIEAPGGDLEFAYRKYPQDPMRLYRFEDGKTYEIPLCVAKHINNDCVIHGNKYLVTVDGDRIVSRDPKTSVQRYQFLSTEFM